MTEAIAVVWFLSVVLVFFLGWIRGNNAGVIETEQRWSEAVLRAEDRRKYAT